MREGCDGLYKRGRKLIILVNLCSKKRKTNKIFMIQTTKLLTSVAFLLFLFTASKPINTPDLVGYDISKFGIPVTVMGPLGAEVSKSELGSMEIDGIKNISVDIEKDMFIMNVNMIDEELDGETMPDLVEWGLELVSEEEGFEVLLQEDAGFIYKTEDPDIGLDHSFMYYMIKDNKEISFTTGLSLFENFTFEQVKEIYEAAKMSK